MSINTKKESIFDNIDYGASFDNLVSTIKDAIESYWETECDIDLIALSNCENIRDEYVLKNDDFFTSQIKIEGHKPVLIRLNKEAIDSLLNNSLESKQEDFNLKKISPLEVKIFNNFCEYIYKQTDNYLTDVKQLKISNLSEKPINLIFAFSTKNSKNAKIILSIPQDRIDMVKLEHKVSFKDEDFIHCSTNIKIRVGYSKLTLEELQNLAKDDTILLENSNLNYMTLVSGDAEQRFKVETSESKITKINNDDDSDNNDFQTTGYNEVTMGKNLWDDIQIELSAEFSKVKMTIGELKQITKGQIVDLGSIFENEISLYIEDKKVAKGELLIINDKYAVKLNEVLSSNVLPNAEEKKPEQKAPVQQAEKPVAPSQKSQEMKEQVQKAIQEPNQKAPSAPQPKHQGTAHAVVEDEEFDYSDFEN